MPFWLSKQKKKIVKFEDHDGPKSSSTGRRGGRLPQFRRFQKAFFGIGDGHRSKSNATSFSTSKKRSRRTMERDPYLTVLEHTDRTDEDFSDCDHEGPHVQVNKGRTGRRRDVKSVSIRMDGNVVQRRGQLNDLGVKKDFSDRNLGHEELNVHKRRTGRRRNAKSASIRMDGKVVRRRGQVVRCGRGAISSSSSANVRDGEEAALAETNFKNSGISPRRNANQNLESGSRLWREAVERTLLRNRISCHRKSRGPRLRRRMNFEKRHVNDSADRGYCTYRHAKKIDR